GSDVTCQLTRPYVTVNPDSAAHMALRVSGPRRWFDEAESHVITLRAQPIGRVAPPLKAHADFHNRPFLPRRALLPLVAGVLLLAGIAALSAAVLSRSGMTRAVATQGTAQTGLPATDTANGAQSSAGSPVAPMSGPVWKALSSMPTARGAVAAATGADGR